MPSAMPQHRLHTSGSYPEEERQKRLVDKFCVRAAWPARVLPALLSSGGIDVDRRDPIGRTALWVAANYGKEQVVRGCRHVCIYFVLAAACLSQPDPPPVAYTPFTAIASYQHPPKIINLYEKWTEYEPP